MNKDTLKKYLLYLDVIKKREIASPSSKILEKDKDDMSQWWDVDNYDFGLSESLFTNFFDNLGVLKILDVVNMQLVQDDLTQSVYDEEKDVYVLKETGIPNQIIIDYVNVNLTKLTAYENTLLSFLNDEEIKNLQVKGSYLGKVLMNAGDFNIHEGGLISYKNQAIHMRTGLRNLCEIFIERPNQLLDRSTLEEGMGIRTRDSKGTVAKYVSALNIILSKFVGTAPIVSFKKEGWTLEI